MFTLPPWPPKDHVLLPVAKSQQSASEFTPIALPRTTQSNLAQYLYPISYKDSDKVTPEIKDVHPTIIENWVQRAKAWWIDKPCLHNFQDMYNMVGGDNNDPVFQHKEKVFNRPFSFEADCVEYKRLMKLQAKSDRESGLKCNYMTGLKEAERLRKKEAEESMEIAPCIWPPPFWWEYQSFPVDPRYAQDQSNVVRSAGDGLGSSAKPKSWTEPPSYFRTIEDPCVRRKELNMVGLPFRNEGCNWYYKNYPPPKLELRPQRFSK